MKELYNSPMADFVEFDEADVIATSGCTKEDTSSGHYAKYSNCKDESYGYCYLAH